MDSVRSDTLEWTSQEHQRRHLTGDGSRLGSGLLSFLIHLSLWQLMVQRQISVCGSHQDHKDADTRFQSVSELAWDSAPPSSARIREHFIPSIYALNYLAK